MQVLYMLHSVQQRVNVNNARIHECSKDQRCKRTGPGLIDKQYNLNLVMGYKVAIEEIGERILYQKSNGRVIGIANTRQD